MRINFLTFGQKGIPLVFLHGWQQNNKSFLSLVPFLNNYKLYFLDLPGFGKSPTLTNANSFTIAKAITAWIKEKNLKKTVLIGHSFGGKIAAIIAAQNPDLIKKLILIASSGLPEKKFWYPILKLIPSQVKKTFSFISLKFTSQDYKKAGPLLPFFKRIVKEDLTSVFKKINQPTLIIWGKNDQELSLNYGYQIQQLIKNSRFKIIGQSHFPFWDKPKKVALAIKKFIQNEKA